MYEQVSHSINKCCRSFRSTNCYFRIKVVWFYARIKACSTWQQCIVTHSCQDRREPVSISSQETADDWSESKKQPHELPTEYTHQKEIANTRGSRSSSEGIASIIPSHAAESDGGSRLGGNYAWFCKTAHFDLVSWNQNQSYCYGQSKRRKIPQEPMRTQSEKGGKTWVTMSRLV